MNWRDIRLAVTFASVTAIVSAAAGIAAVRLGAPVGLAMTVALGAGMVTGSVITAAGMARTR